MRFSCSCLTVSKNSAVISFEHALNDGQGGLFEDSFLEAAWFEGEIEAEDPFLLTDIFGVVDDYFSAIGDDVDDGFVFILDFSRGEGSTPDGNFDAFALCHFNVI